MDNNRIMQNLDILMDTFQINEVKQCVHLQDFLSTKKVSLKQEYQNIFNILVFEIQDKGEQWNEEELKMKFLALLFFIAEMEEKGKIQAFYERPLMAQIAGHKLSVKTDCMFATPLGKNTPREPYFFLQEFKKGKGDKYDPEAQMLTAMLIAQHKNKNITSLHPIYGAYIIGKNWTFATLYEQKYCKSKQFDASDENQLLAIISILKGLKDLVLT
jgi:hypothetical protein